MGLRRRAFLQRASLALGALGVGSTALLGGASQYQQALAKPARRKLALLIGINQYPERAIDSILAQDVALKGCLMDVELQRQLLVHRFGFQPVDIFTLTNQEATRAGILAAIDEHLVQQAEADDIVVLHFSGYGSQVRVAGDTSGIKVAWVPVDSHLPSESNPALVDLLEEDLAQRLQALATSNVTTVIDAGSQDMGFLRWGNMKVRSRPAAPTGSLSSRLNASDNQALRISPQWPGLVLRAGDIGHLVLENQWDTFSAGVFTYALTQSLWETLPDPSPKILIQRTANRLKQWTGPDQQPSLGGTLATKAGPTAYFLPAQIPPADGVVLPSADTSRPLSLWLGGLSPTVLRYLQPGSRFLTLPVGAASSALLPAAGATSPGAVELQLESRNGLKAVAKPVEPGANLALGRQPLYEKVRRLPQSVGLVVALDSQLQRVERVDATSALASIPFVTSITAGEKSADCLFGRLIPGATATLTAALPNGNGAPPKSAIDQLVDNSYGLFAPNRTLISGTLLGRDEAVKTAVGRLLPQLQTLLAAKLVRLTQNQTSSWLGATATLETTQPKPQVLMAQQTERSGLSPTAPAGVKRAPKPAFTPSEMTLTTDSRIVYRIANRSAQSLHLLFLRFDSRGDCTALMLVPEPTDTKTGAEDGPIAIAPGQTQVLPSHDADWAVSSAAAWVETHVVLSTQPLQRCLQVLRQEGGTAAAQAELRHISQPLKLTQALLQDLSYAMPGADTNSPPTDHYALHQDQWVTFTFTYAIG